MSIKFWRLALITSLVAFGMTACSGDNKEGEGDFGGGEGTMEQLSPEDSKEFLQSSSEKIMDVLNASDQEAFIKTVEYFGSHYGELDFPEEAYGMTTDYDAEGPSNFLNNVKKAASRFSAPAMAAAVETTVYNMDFTKCKGVYEPASYEWRKVADSDNLVFRFDNYDGQIAVLTFEPSGNYSDIHYTDEYGGYDEYYKDEYNVKVPKTVKVSLVSGRKSLMSGTVESDINKNGHKISASANLTVANIAVKANISGTDGTIEATYETSVNGTPFAKQNATIKGNHLCDIDYLAKVDDDEVAVYNIIESGTSTINAMDLVQIDAKATFTRDFVRVINTEYDSYYFNSKDEARDAISKDLEVYKKNLKANLRYNNKTTVQAELDYDIDFYEYYSDWEYMVMPIIKFPDETTYTFEDYFETGFNSVINQWEALIRSYERLIED